MARIVGLRHKTDMHPSVLQDLLNEVQQMAEAIVRVGYHMNQHYGPQWAARALIIHRDIMAYHSQITRVARGERVAPNSSRAVRGITLPDALK